VSNLVGVRDSGPEQWLPLIASFACALALAPAVIGALQRAGLVRANWRGAQLPAALGLAAVAGALVALAPLAALEELADADVLAPATGDVLLYGLGVAFLGFVDDVLGGRAPAGAGGEHAPRGWRGHGGAAVRGGLSTGMLKAVGALALALFLLSRRGLPAGEYLLAVAVLVLSTNAFNLLDLRPGRALKVFLLLGIGLTVGAWDTDALLALGILLGAVLALAPFDLGERAMLGDAGSNLIGALAGLWLIYTLSPAGQLVALAVLVGITIFGEFRSISEVVERNPLLRRLDSLGRRA
jgi:UDP-GlcNAc:undecaprenyl-phosphate/decaprenyl-phosphate GlcNAc-1-phosphate transferase